MWVASLVSDVNHHPVKTERLMFHSTHRVPPTTSLLYPQILEGMVFAGHSQLTSCGPVSPLYRCFWSSREVFSHAQAGKFLARLSTAVVSSLLTII